MQAQEILTIKNILEIVPLSRATIYTLIENANFPAPKKLPGSKKSMWYRSEVAKWLEENLK